MNKVRIIAGRWRGRWIQFVDAPALRPTQDRIRETLFNWLQPYITDSRCLDCFAGSGVLGLEALSRGALSLTFIDNHAQQISQLKQNLKALAANDTHKVVLSDCMSCHASELDAPYDIVFLDPPFHQNLLPAAVRWLQDSGCVKNGTLVYMECERHCQFDTPDNWQCRKEKETKTLRYALYQVVE